MNDLLQDTDTKQFIIKLFFEKVYKSLANIIKYLLRWIGFTLD